MSSTKEIKAHITGIKNTQKITNAMKLISTTKLRRARGELEQTRPYFDAIYKEISRIIYLHREIKSPYFTDKAEDTADEPRGILVITADKGLAGAYNHNVIKEAEKLLTGDGKACKLYVIGDSGRNYFRSRGISYVQDFRFSLQEPSLHQSRKLSLELVRRFDEDKLKSLYVVYTDFHNGLNVVPVTARLLPLSEATITREQSGDVTDFEYLPSPKAVLESIIPAYVNGFIYGALVDSYCSEQSARMTAMDNANQNAEDILDRLSQQYNHVRQNGITQEITEISAGARWREHNSKQEEHL